MSTLNFVEYNPPAPTPGLTVINILFAEKKTDATYLFFDIGVGPSAGYAFVQFQQTGNWPLVWRISVNPKADAAYECALKAAQYVDPNIASLEDVQNITIAAELGYDVSGNIRVCRSYPNDRCIITPATIQVGTSSWANGSPDFIRASLIARNAGLPVLLADMHEKDSPMVVWCAENGIAIQPMLFPAGDYRLPLHDTVVDRKNNLLELYENFVMPDKRLAYEMDAVLAAAHGRKLVYVTSTMPGDQVNTVKDLQKWSAKVPGKMVTADGAKLFYQITRHQRFFPHVEFVFCDEKKLCTTIYNILQN